MIDYEEDWLCVLLIRTAGSVSGRACSFAIPATILTLGLLFMDDFVRELRAEYDLMDLDQGTVWSAVTTMVVFLIGFRTKNAYGRFWQGTGLLHQMRGEWFDTVSNCVTFSIRARKQREEEVMKFRHTLVRLMSLAHGNALEELSDNQFELDTIDAHGLDLGTLRHLKHCHEHCKFNKVEVLLHLIQSLITNAHVEGVIDIPPPILSRVYQTISRGFVNLLNSKKIQDTKFPFPYVQLIAALMLAFTIMTPVVVSSFVKNKIIAGTITFIPVFGVASLNAIAQELENPFGMDDNDLPIAHFQEEMDRCLLMLLHPNSDIIATTSPKAELDFDKLLSSFGHADPHSSSEMEPGSPKLEDKGTRVKRFDSETLAAEEQPSPAETPMSPATPASNQRKIIGFSPKVLSSPWSNPPDANAKRKQKRFDTEALAINAAELEMSTPSSEPTPTKISSAWEDAQGKQILEQFSDPHLSEQNLTADLKLLLKTNMATFVKSIESLTNVLHHQADMLSATSDIIHNPTVGTVQARTLPQPKAVHSYSVDLESQTRAGSRSEPLPVPPSSLALQPGVWPFFPQSSVAL